MYFREDSKAAAELLKQAIPLMVERKVPTDPCNFALWYAYVADRDNKLKQQLDQNYSETGQYQPEQNEQLFFDYFIKPYMSENEEANESMVSLLSGLFGTVKKTEEGTREYGEALQQGLQSIKQNESDPVLLEETLSTLLEKTEDVDNMNRQFQKELRSAKEEIESLKKQLVNSEKDAFLDALTKIGNRRAFDRTLFYAMAEPSADLSLLIIDLDHFKKCNDTYGHLTGDRILSAIGQLLGTFSDDHIKVARYGGEEFGVVLSKGSLQDAAELAESIRTKVANIKIKLQGQVIDNITASIGVAERQPGEDKDTFIQRADKALYHAKQNGRNQVQCAEFSFAETNS